MQRLPIFRYAFVLALLPALFSIGETQASPQRKKKQPAIPLGVDIVSGIEFANPDGHSLKLDLYRPKNRTGKLPVVIFVHGGGWKNGSKATGRKYAWLASEGFALVSISYRLTDQGQWPDQINDCYEAVRWVRRNAEQYGFDGERVGCWGTSAGGHLAALMGTRSCPEKEDVSSRVQAVCDWFGPSELLTMPPNNVGNGRTEEDVAQSNGAKLLGATVREVPELAKDASALDNVSDDDAAFLIMHGDADAGVPLEQSQKLHQRLKNAGVSSKLIVVPGAGHGGSEFQSADSKQAVITFFQEKLKD